VALTTQDGLLLHGRALFPRQQQEVKPEDLDHGIKACASFLKLLHHLPIPSHPNLQYLVFICLVILWIRCGKNAPETEHTITLIQAQIKSDFVGYGDAQGPDSYDTAKALARIIDDYTPL